MKKSLVTLCTLLVLGGCAGRPSDQLVLSPDLPRITASSQGSLALSAGDARTNQTAVTIRKGDERPKTHQLANPPEQFLGELFRSAFNRAGYDVDPGASNSLDIKVERLHSDIKETLLGYEASNEIIINVYARNQQQMFSKRYSIRGSMKGAINLDLATLELELNKLLTKVAGDIVNDPELNQFLAR